MLQPPGDVSVNEALMWKPFLYLCYYICYWCMPFVWCIICCAGFHRSFKSGCTWISHDTGNVSLSENILCFCYSKREGETDRWEGRAGGVACWVGSGLPWQTLSLLLVSSAAHAAACVYHMAAHTALGTSGLHVSRNVQSRAWTTRLDWTHTGTWKHTCRNVNMNTHTSCSVQWSAWGNVHHIHSTVRSLQHNLCFRPDLWNAKWNL